MMTPQEKKIAKLLESRDIESVRLGALLLTQETTISKDDWFNILALYVPLSMTYQILNDDILIEYSSATTTSTVYCAWIR